jgi:hypothetical protein
MSLDDALTLAAVALALGWLGRRAWTALRRRRRPGCGGGCGCGATLGARDARR